MTALVRPTFFSFDWFRSLFGSRTEPTTIELAPAREAERYAPTSAGVVGPLSLWEAYQRVGGSITPTQLSAIMREADGGEVKRFVQLAIEARQKDGHLHGCLEQAELAIANLGWRLSLPDDARPRDREAADWCTATLRATPTLARGIGHAARAFYFGHATSEILWSVRGGKLVPALSPIDPRRFAFRPSDGQLVWRDEGMPRDGIDLRAEYPDHFLISQPVVTGDLPCREGLARLLLWAAIFRSWTLTDWLRLGEIAWKPWRVGRYEKNASKEDIAGLTNVLEGMSGTSVALIPDSVELDVKFAPGATTKPTHSELFETLAREMAKAVLGQTETIQASTSSGYAQAKVHADVRKDLLEARARSVAADLTRDVIGPMIRMNFGEAVAVPEFRFVTEDRVDLKAFAESIATFADAGVVIPQGWIRDEAGIPEPTAGEPTVGDSKEDA